MKYPRPFVLFAGSTFVRCRERGDLLKAAQGLAVLWSRPLESVREAVLGWHVVGEEDVDGHPAPLFSNAGCGITLERWAGSWGVDLSLEFLPNNKRAFAALGADVVTWMHQGMELSLRALKSSETADCTCVHCRTCWRLVAGGDGVTQLEGCPLCEARPSVPLLPPYNRGDDNMSSFEKDFEDECCRMCQCTEDAGCEPSCYWVQDPMDVVMPVGDRAPDLSLCSACLSASMNALRRLLQGMGTLEDLQLVCQFAELSPPPPGTSSPLGLLQLPAAVAVGLPGAA